MLLVGLTAVQVNAKIILDDKAIEAENLVVKVKQSGGYVRVKACRRCSEVILKVNHSTAVTVNGQSAALNSELNQTRGPGTVIFNPKNSTVSRLELYRKE